jgi:hypothetical protein
MVPERIVIGPHTYRVELDTGAACRSNRNPDAMGCSDPRALVMTLAADLAPSQLADTLLHEVMHAVYTNAGQPAAEGSEEAFIGAVASGLLDTLRRNPDLAKLLCTAEQEAP